MEARAQAKMIRVSPQKARLVVDLVRGKNVKEALGILEYVNKSATPATTLKRFRARAKVAVLQIFKEQATHVWLLKDRRAKYGSKVSPVGLRVGVNRDWNSDGTLMIKTLLHYYTKILEFH